MNQLAMIADFLTLLSTTLFPLFAAYKALKSPSPVTLAPWLVFYATLSVVHLLENTVLLPLTYVPFYSWVRFIGHLYLLMPAPQGAAQVYTSYIEPFLQQHENDIEDFISNTHEKLRALGLQYFKQALDWFRVNILGASPRPSTPPASTSQTYAQQLLSRFYAPSAASGTATPPLQAGTGLYNSIFAAVQAASGGLGPRTTTRSADITASGNLIPPELSSQADRLKYVQQAREGLDALMKAFDKEEVDIAEGKAPEGLTKSRSEIEFDKIERSEVSPDRGGKSMPAAQRTTSSGWMPWNWRGEAKVDEAAAAKKEVHEGPVEDVPAEGKSSGTDLRGH